MCKNLLFQAHITKSCIMEKTNCAQVHPKFSISLHILCPTGHLNCMPPSSKNNLFQRHKWACKTTQGNISYTAQIITLSKHIKSLVTIIRTKDITHYISFTCKYVCTLYYVPCAYTKIIYVYVCMLLLSA